MDLNLIINSRDYTSFSIAHGIIPLYRRVHIAADACPRMRGMILPICFVFVSTLIKHTVIYSGGKCNRLD